MIDLEHRMDFSVLHAPNEETYKQVEFKIMLELQERLKGDKNE